MLADAFASPATSLIAKRQCAVSRLGLLWLVLNAAIHILIEEDQLDRRNHAAREFWTVVSSLLLLRRFAYGCPWMRLQCIPCHIGAMNLRQLQACLAPALTRYGAIEDSWTA